MTVIRLVTRSKLPN